MQRPTPQTHRFELVAQIHKTKGLDGQLVAQELGGLSVLYPGLEVWIVPPVLGVRRHTAVSAVQRNPHKQGVLISLEGIDNRSDAQELTQRYLLAPLEQLEGLGQDEDSSQLLTSEYAEDDQRASDQQEARPGHEFIDVSEGSLGVLDSIKQGPAYDIWVVKGSYGILEIPAVQAYVVSEQAGKTVLDLPQGFIQITAQEAKDRDADSASEAPNTRSLEGEDE